MGITEHLFIRSSPTSGDDMSEVSTPNKNLRLEMMKFFIQLGFTKRDMQLAMQVNSLYTIKDDLRDLRIAFPEKIPQHLTPAEKPMRLRQAIEALSLLEDRMQTCRATDTMIAIHDALQHWLNFQPLHLSSSRYQFPTLIHKDGKVIPFERLATLIRLPA